MSNHALEIVQLENGDVVLRRSDEDQQVLLRLEFSEEIDKHLAGIKLEVAKAMIQGGAGAYADLKEMAVDVEDEPQPSNSTLH